mmetsp:Transcript_552/g.1294  ORF Transcript_552/g.1294 Transcript_552/m.1294 type:complete len:224 (-) Transcript_552:196-867(-)
MYPRMKSPEPTCTTRPSSMYAAMSACSSSSRRCVTHTAVTRSLSESTTRRTARTTPAWSASSKNVVSSSSSSTRGFSTSAPAMATRCFCPPLSVDTWRCSISSPPRFTASSARVTRPCTSASDRSRRCPSPNATSAPTLGMITWWSGFWNTNARGACTRSRPLHGVTSPANDRSRVDLPLPLGPSSMKRVPRGTRRDTPDSASTLVGDPASPYRTYSSSASTP